MKKLKTLFLSVLARLGGTPPQPQLTGKTIPQSQAQEKTPGILSEALLRAAISARLQAVLKESAATAEKDDRTHRSQAERRATEIIARIPRLMEAEFRTRASVSARRGQAFRSWTSTVSIMDLEAYETTDDRYTKDLSPGALRYAARLVYDYCAKAGLEPCLYQSDGIISGKGHHIWMSVTGTSNFHSDVRAVGNRQNEFLRS
jgi:hypothetical protein